MRGIPWHLLYVLVSHSGHADSETQSVVQGSPDEYYSSLENFSNYFPTDPQANTRLRA